MHRSQLLRPLASVALVLGCLSVRAEDGAKEDQFAPPSRGETITPEDAKDRKPLPISSRDAVMEALNTAEPKGETEPRPDANVTLSGEKGIYLSLEDCIEIAIQNNLALRISRLDDRSSDINVRAAWARYYPEFNASILHRNSRRVGNETGDGSTSVTGGITQRSPWGTTLNFDVSETRSRFNTETATGNFNIGVTQPLWQGAGTDVGLAQIRTARINRLISRGNLDLDVQQLIFAVRTQYADVIRQIQERDVNRQAVRSDKAFLDLTVAREQAGQVTKLDVFNAEVSLNGRKLNLISNERNLETAYDRLKQSMDVDLEESIRVDDEVLDFGERSEPGVNKELVSDDVSGTVRLVVSKDGKPVGEPKTLFEATRFDDKVVLQEALDNRIELLNSRRSLAIQKLQTLLARDGLGHQIDLTGGFGRSNTGRSILESDNGNDVNDWSVGINARFPWGKISDRAAYENALLDLQRAEIGLKQVRTQVQSDIRDSLRTLRENEKRLLIEGQRVENAKRSVEAAQSRFDRGLTDSFNVIRAGDDLLRAKTSFVQNKLFYIVELARLELRVGKPSGRVDLAGQTVGGLVDSKIPEGIKSRGLPRPQPDPEPRPEDDPHNNSREYRKDYKPKGDDPVIIEEVK